MRSEPSFVFNISYRVFWLCGILFCCVIFLPFLYGFQTPVEICNNAIDDDGDGDIDLNDSDCSCEIFEVVSLIPNPSFEQKSCCPSDRSQLNCADTWIQASVPTTDYLHQCGWMGWDNFPPPEPFPDGEGIIGFRDGRRVQNSDGPELEWKEYAGACLLEPLLANKKYRFEFELGFTTTELSPRIDITFFGTTDCTNLPFGGKDDLFGCPTNGPGWVKLGSKMVSSTKDQEWVKVSIGLIPTEDIYAIVVGPPCTPTIAADAVTYYFFDNLVLADAKSFEFIITEINHPCNSDFSLQVPLEADIIYEWYKDGIALVGENSNTLSKMYGEGSYQLQFQDQSGCKLTEAYEFSIPKIFNEVALSICKEESYQFGNQLLESSGTYESTFLNSNNCDSIVTLTLTVLSENIQSVSAKIFEGETYDGIDNYTFRNQGNHTAQLISDIGCDSIVSLSLEYYNVYFPNVFTPNNDGQHDYFKISGSNDLKEIKEITIYDHWGTEVYYGQDELAHESPGWNGKKQGQEINPGIYTYVTTVIMDDDLERTFVGSILLLK